MWFMQLLSYVATIFHFIFCTLSLAAGLYYIAEAVEEYSSVAAKVIKYSIYFTTSIFGMLYLFEGFPLYLILIGLLSNVDYYILLNTFPYISISQPTFVIGSVMVLVNHYLAFQYFATVYYSFTEILAYFTICLWIVPFSFFVSLSINECVLPTMQTMDAPSHQLGSNAPHDLFQRPRRSGLLGLFDMISEKKDKMKEDLFGRSKMF